MSLAEERRIFDACVGLAAPDRARWLDEHCTDPQLRRRVDRLLALHDAAESGEAGLRTAAHGPREQYIGPYRLLEIIGEGAMGEVYLAEQEQPVVRRVALKIIKPGLNSREIARRFEAERMAVSILSHPNIAQFIDAGTSADGRPYFVMEYVPGVALTRYCVDRKLPVRERIELIAVICDAVQHAHRRGIIHRDLKPSNILVTERDGETVPKIIDFGIAKATSGALQPNHAHTLIGSFVGTPEYMSPEQARLSPLDVDTRTDVYSLGVVLYELLTGALPVSAATVDRDHTDVVPPSIRAEQSGFARELDWIVLKALRVDRSERYGSPAELGADLRRHLSNEIVLARPPTVAYRLRKFVVRNRLVVAVLSTSFVALAAFGALSRMQAIELARERDEARFQARRADASSEFMSLLFQEVGPGGAAMSMTALLDRGVRMLERQYQSDPQFVAQMLLQMARRYMDIEDTKRQLEVLERAGAIAREIGDQELLARINCAAVQTLLQSGQSSAAPERLQSARQALARVSAPSLDARVDCLRAEARLLRARGQPAEARKQLASARRLLEVEGQTSGLPYVATLTDLGIVDFATGDYRSALDVSLRAQRALELAGRDGTMSMATTLINIGQLQYRLGEVREAEATGREALRRLQAARASQSIAPSQVVAFAITLVRAAKVTEAQGMLERAWADARVRGNTFWAMLAEFHLGRALLMRGDLDGARTRFDAVEAGWAQDPVANEGRLHELEAARVELDLAAGATGRGLERASRLLSSMGYPSARSAPALRAALVVAARAALATGDVSRARSWASDAVVLATATSRDPDQSADVGEARLVLAQVLEAAEASDAALEAASAAVRALTAGLGAEHALAREAVALRASLVGDGLSR